MWRRANGVMAGIVAAITTSMLVVALSQPSQKVPGIVVPAMDGNETAVPTVTAVDVAETGTATAPPAGNAPVGQQQPTNPQAAAASQPTTPKPLSGGVTSANPTNAPAPPPPPPPPPAPQPPAKPRFDPAASFRIVNVANSLSLDSGGKVQPGTPMKLWLPSPSPNLQFQLIETDGGYYRLINRANGLAVDGRGARQQGAYVGQRPWDSSPNLQWLPTDIGNGTFTLANRATGLMLDGDGRSGWNGSQAIQWPANGGPHQLWRIVI